MPPTDIRGAGAQLEGDVVAAACEGGWQLPCLSLGSLSLTECEHIICIFNVEQAAGVVPQEGDGCMRLIFWGKLYLKGQREDKSQLQRM